jgi:hypothetical protein
MLMNVEHVGLFLFLGDIFPIFLCQKIGKQFWKPSWMESYHQMKRVI